MRFLGVCQGPINRRSANAESLSDFGRAKTIGLELTHLRRVYGRWAPLVNAGFLRLGDSFKLAFFSEIGFELGEHAELDLSVETSSKT
jgi:hypothetical protein